MVPDSTPEIRHLVVIAGPSASGKTTLINAVLKNEIPGILPLPGIREIHRFPALNAWERDSLKASSLDGLILHYDCLFDGGRGLDLIDAAKDVSFITLRPPWTHLVPRLIRGKLRKNITGSAFDSAKAWFFTVMPDDVIRRSVRLLLFLLPRSLLKYHLSVLELYEHEHRVDRIYRNWFTFCRRYSHKTRCHIMIESESAAGTATLIHYSSCAPNEYCWRSSSR